MFLFMSEWPYAHTTHVQVQESKKRFTYEVDLCGYTGLLNCALPIINHSMQAYCNVIAG